MTVQLISYSEDQKMVICFSLDANGKLIAATLQYWYVPGFGEDRDMF